MSWIKPDINYGLEVIYPREFARPIPPSLNLTNKQTNKQYVSSIINYKNTFKVIIFSKHCFSNFSSSNFGDFTAVFGLLSRHVYCHVTVTTKRLVRAPCWKQSTGYIPEDLQARHVKYVLNQKSNPCGL